jgi:hypothetical protein
MGVIALSNVSIKYLSLVITKVHFPKSLGFLHLPHSVHNHGLLLCNETLNPHKIFATRDCNGILNEKKPIKKDFT